LIFSLSFSVFLRRDGYSAGSNGRELKYHPLRIGPVGP